MVTAGAHFLSAGTYFYYEGMLSRYGFGFEEKNGDTEQSNVSGPAIQNGYNIATKPFYLNRSGNVSIYSNMIEIPGNSGSVWGNSTNRDSLQSATAEIYYVGSIFPAAYTWHRYPGFSLR